MKYEEMERKINMAGAWFKGAFIGEFVVRFHEWNDKVDGKVDFIKQFQENYGEGLGYAEASIKMKCYAVMSIVEHHKVLDAIEFVLNCNSKRVSEDAVENAIALLDKICRDEIELP